MVTRARVDKGTRVERARTRARACGHIDTPGGSMIVTGEVEEANDDVDVWEEEEG